METTEGAGTTATIVAATTDHDGPSVRPFVRTRMLPPAAAALAFCLSAGLVAGCSSDESSSSTTLLVAATATAVDGALDTAVPTTTGAAPDTSASTVPVATEAPTTTAPPPDPVALLAAAFDALAGGYHFATTVTVNDVVAVTADGDRVGDGIRANVTTGGTTVSYAITAEGTWVLADGNWSELDQPAPAVDPVGALRTPVGVVVSSYGTGPTVLTGSYLASALSLPGDGPVEVALEIDGTTLRSITYASTQNGTPATVRADISPLIDVTPVTLPSV